MSTQKTELFDIIIVGGGMVGLTMAALLCRQQSSALSLRLALIDSQELQQKDFSRDKVENFDPRVSALTVANSELFSSLGLWDELLADSACPYRDMEVWDADGTGHISFSNQDVRQDELGYILENSAIDRALNSALAEQTGLSQFRGQAVKAYEKQGELNILQLADGRTLRANLVIAADGANSFIRQEAGFKLREWEYGHEAIVATVATEKPHALTASQCFLPSGPLAFLPLRDKDDTQHFSSIVWSCEKAKAQALLALDDAAFSLHLQQAFESKLGRTEAVSPRYSFPLWQRHARDYVQDGLALIGDAAHSIHPLAGQGVNMGLQDARCLAEVLVQARLKDEDISSEQVLSRYQRQRKGPNLGMMGLMEAFKRGFASDDLALRWLRNVGLNVVDKAGPIKRKLMHKAMGL